MFTYLENNKKKFKCICHFVLRIFVNIYGMYLIDTRLTIFNYKQTNHRIYTRERNNIGKILICIYLRICIRTTILGSIGQTIDMLFINIKQLNRVNLRTISKSTVCYQANMALYFCNRQDISH